jgi:inner membrane protein
LLITHRAYAAVRGWAGERATDAVFASPAPAWSWRRELVWREGDCYRWSAYRPFGGGLMRVTACKSSGMQQPLVLEAMRGNPELRAFLRWSVLPLADVQRSRCSATVSIGDARYGRFGVRARLKREAVVPTGAPGC